MDFFTFRKECQYFQPEDVSCVYTEEFVAPSKDGVRCFMSTCPLLKAADEQSRKKVCPNCGDDEGYFFIVSKNCVGKWGEAIIMPNFNILPPIEEVKCLKCKKTIKYEKA